LPLSYLSSSTPSLSRSIAPPSVFFFSFFTFPYAPLLQSLDLRYFLSYSRVVFSLLCDEISGPATTEAFLSLQYTQNLQYEEEGENTTPGQNRTIRALKIKPDDDETSKGSLFDLPKQIHSQLLSRALLSRPS
jgi:hypothetical protein